MQAAAWVITFTKTKIRGQASVKVLFLALEPPYPPNDGGRIRTFELLKQLARQCQVTLLAFSSAKQPDADWTPLRQVCHEVYVIPRPAPARLTVSEQAPAAPATPTAGHPTLRLRPDGWPAAGIDR